MNKSFKAKVLAILLTFGVMSPALVLANGGADAGKAAVETGWGIAWNSICNVSGGLWALATITGDVMAEGCKDFRAASEAVKAGKQVTIDAAKVNGVRYVIGVLGTYFALRYVVVPATKQVYGFTKKTLSNLLPA